MIDQLMSVAFLLFFACVALTGEKPCVMWLFCLLILGSMLTPWEILVELSCTAATVWAICDLALRNAKIKKLFIGTAKA